MKDEIKEILDYISDRVIEKEKWDKVRDYITNLQKENERLKEWKEDLLNENINLEDIRKKTIKCLTKNKFYIDLNEVLNILKEGKQ